MTCEHVDVRRANILRILREAPGPLTLTEVWERCPYEQAPWAREPSRPSTANINANLHQLQRQGLVSRIQLIDPQASWWQANPERNEMTNG